MKELMMNKKIVITGLGVIVLCLGAGLFCYVGKNNSRDIDATVTASETAVEERVTVSDINIEETTRETKPEETEESTTVEPETAPASELAPPVTTTAEKKIPEQKKAESKPQVPDQAIEPSREPESQEIVPSHEATEHSTNATEAPAGGTTDEEGKVYVPGFGYVETGGTVTEIPAHSNGDWNKQVGTMQ